MKETTNKADSSTEPMIVEPQTTENITDPDTSMSQNGFTSKDFSLMNNATANENDLEVEELMKTCMSEMIIFLEEQEKRNETTRPTPQNVTTKVEKRCKVEKRKKAIRIHHSTSKVVADLFEALIGAIFLDSNCSFETVVQVVEHIRLLSTHAEVEKDVLKFCQISNEGKEETPVKTEDDTIIGKKRTRGDEVKFRQQDASPQSVAMEVDAETQPAKQNPIAAIEVQEKTIGQKRKQSFDEEA